MPVDQRSDVLTDKIVSQFLSREHPSLAGVHEWYRPKSVKRGAGTLVDGEKQMFGLDLGQLHCCAGCQRVSDRPVT